MNAMLINQNIQKFLRHNDGPMVATVCLLVVKAGYVVQYLSLSSCAKRIVTNVMPRFGPVRLLQLKVEFSPPIEMSRSLARASKIAELISSKLGSSST